MIKFVLTVCGLAGSSPNPRSHNRAQRIYRSDLSLLHRAVGIVVVAAQLLTLQPTPVHAASNTKAPPAPATQTEKRNIQAPVAPPNRTLPDLGADPVKPVALPATPTDAEITADGGFIEPLVPIGGRTTPADNKALAGLLGAWRARADLEDFTLIDRFVGQHPKSPWVAALLLNKGLECRKRGYFSVALIAWQETWSRAKNETAPSGHALADRAAGELAELNARLGRYEWLEPFFQDAPSRGRPRRGLRERARDYGSCRTSRRTRFDAAQWHSIGSAPVRIPPSPSILKS